jgi:hypothetical protein
MPYSLNIVFIGDIPMITVPSDLQARFEERMKRKEVLPQLWWQYKKWLRYYLDFCQKYNHRPAQKESLPRFIEKLQDKKQDVIQQINV